jgi:hypothetical protein
MIWNIIYVILIILIFLPWLSIAGILLINDMYDNQVSKPLKEGNMKGNLKNYNGIGRQAPPPPPPKPRKK